jgi:hypothetical protein
MVVRCKGYQRKTVAIEHVRYLGTLTSRVSGGGGYPNVSRDIWRTVDARVEFELLEGDLECSCMTVEPETADRMGMQRRTVRA